MENKKTLRADLENKKNIFFETGLIIALATVLFAFEWKTSNAELSDFITVSELPPEIDVIPITKMEPLPLPPPPPAPKLSDLLNIVEDENSIDEELEIKDADDNSDNLDVPDADNFWKYDAEGSIEDDVFVIVEDLPQFPGGNVSKWIARNVHYPAIAEANGIEGKVYVKFIIERDGSVTHVEIMRGADSMLDKEAIRVISAMPKWKPGKQRGKAVRVSYTLPISFRLNH